MLAAPPPPFFKHATWVGLHQIYWTPPFLKTWIRPWVHGCGRMGQTSRCFIVCSSPHSHVVCSSSLNPHFCIRDLHRPVPVRRRLRLDQVGHASLEPGGSDSLGLNESLCGVVWRWLDQRVSLRVRALPSRGSTEWRKLCFDCSLFLAGSCSYRGCRGSFSCLCFSGCDETARLICGGGRGQFRTTSIGHLYSRWSQASGDGSTGSVQNWVDL